MSHIITPNKRIIRVSNDFLHSDLSLSAKGLMLYMTSQSNTWEFSIERMSHALKEGKTAIRNALHELEQAHYIVRHVKRYKNKTTFITKSTYSLAHIESETHYTLVSHQVLQHATLSLKAKAVYAIAWSLHRNTAFSVQLLADIIKTSTHTIKTTLCELIDHAFLTRTQTKDQGKFARALYTFFDTPQHQSVQINKETQRKHKSPQKKASFFTPTVSQKTASQKPNDIDKTYTRKNDDFDTITKTISSFMQTITLKQQELIQKQQQKLTADILHASKERAIHNLTAYTLISCRNYLQFAKKQYRKQIALQTHHAKKQALQSKQELLYAEFRALDAMPYSDTKYEQQKTIADAYNAINDQYKDHKRRENLSVFEEEVLTIQEVEETNHLFDILSAV